MDVDGGAAVPDMIAMELASDLTNACVALRSGRRFVEADQPAKDAPGRELQGLPANPVVLITGGLGHMGL